MKKSFLFKGVSILGAVLLLANVVLPGLAYAANSITVDDGTITASVFTPSASNKINLTCNNGTRHGYNEGNFGIDWNGTDELVIKDKGLVEIDGSKWVGLIVDFGVPVVGIDNYGIENDDIQDASCYGATSDTAFVVWLRPESNAVSAGSMTFQNSSDSADKVTINVEFKTGYTVTFDANGGTLGDGSEDQVVAYSGSVTKPANDPTRDGYSFAGWYNGNVAFDFTTDKVGDDLTLTAKWNSVSKSSGGGGGGSSKTSTTDDTKATTGDTAKVDENNTEENKDENANEEENKGEEKSPMTDAQAVEKFGQEQIDAYKWALENGITTMKTVEAARLDEPLTRAELAKMMVVYIQKVLEKDPIVTGDVNYPDVDESLGDLYGYIKLAYQYQIMGINADGTPIELFNPYGLVTRGEYATVFSRVLFGDKFNKTGEDFYTKHLEALKAAGILTNTIPTIQEMRGWVMLMMYRSSQNAEKIENVANTTETNEEEKADEETATASDETKSEANEEEKAEEATNTEATTGDVAETPATQESSETTAENTETTAEATTGDVAEAPTAEASTGDTASN